MNRDLIRQLLEMHDELHGFIYSIVRDYHVAQDLLQEVSMVAIDQVQRGEEILNLRAWVKQVARHQVMNHWRERRRHRANMPVEELANVAAEAFSEFNDDAQVVADEREALHRCLGQTPERMRTMLRLRYLEQRDFSVIAKTVGRNEDAVRQAISRTRRLLAECLQRQLRGPVGNS